MESQTIDRATIAKINFILKGHSKFPFISSLKILGCAKTRRAPVFPTIQYIQFPYYVDFGTGKKAIYRNLRKLNNFKTQIPPLTH